MLTENVMGEQIGMFDQDTWFGKTYQVPSAATEEKTLERSSRKSSGSYSKRLPMFLYLTRDGQKPDVSQEWVTTVVDGPSLTDYTMHSFGEYPNEERESRLSQILEDSPLPKYSLSAKACDGILRRAERRGKELPPELERALRDQSVSKSDSENLGGGKGILIQNEHTGALSTSNNQSVCAGFCTEHSEKARGIGYQEEMAPTLRAGTVPAATMSLNSKQLGLDTAVELASTLGASDYKEPQAVLAVDMGGGKGSCNIQKDKAPTLATTHGGEPAVLSLESNRQTALGFNRERCGAVVGEEVMPTIQAAAGESGNNKPMVAVFAKTARPKFKGDAETIVESEIAPTLNTFDTGDKRTSVFCLQGNGIDRADTAGCNGKGWTKDFSYTLNTIDRPAVVLIENHPQDSRVQIREDGIVQTLDARMGMGGGNVPMVIEHRDDSVGE